MLELWADFFESTFTMPASTIMHDKETQDFELVVTNEKRLLKETKNGRDFDVASISN